MPTGLHSVTGKISALNDATQALGTLGEPWFLATALNLVTRQSLRGSYW